MVKEAQSSSEEVVRHSLHHKERKAISHRGPGVSALNDRRNSSDHGLQRFPSSSAVRNRGIVKKVPRNRPRKGVLPLKKPLKRPTDVLVNAVKISPRLKFAEVFKPPTVAVEQPTDKMHPTETDVEKTEEHNEQPVLKIMIDKLDSENGVNGRTEHENPVAVEEDTVADTNGHNNHRLEVEEDIVDVVEVPEEAAALIATATADAEAAESAVDEEVENHLVEQSSGQKLRNSSRLSTSSRSSSPADSVLRERTARKLNYVPTTAATTEESVQEKLEVSVAAGVDDLVKGGAEDLEVSVALSEPSKEKSPKPKSQVKTVTSPVRAKKSPKPAVTPTPTDVEDVLVRSGRRTRKAKSPQIETSPRSPSPVAPFNASALDEPQSAYSSGSAIRSVRCRRPIRRSRNISALDSSLHNQSSPWDEEYKILSPRGGGVSLANISVTNGDESPLSVSVSNKRKASEDEVDEKEPKKYKNDSSHTSSFFSVVTSPISALKERFRGGTLSSSTPFHKTDKQSKSGFESDASMLSAEENGAGEEIASNNHVAPVAPGKSWCSLM